MKLYFVEVQTYQSVNAMMKEIGKWVWLNFDHHIMSESMWNKMVEAIRQKMNDEISKHPRSKPIKLDESTDQTKCGMNRTICVKSVNQFNDNFAFILTGKGVHTVELKGDEFKGFLESTGSSRCKIFSKSS